MQKWATVMLVTSPTSVTNIDVAQKRAPHANSFALWDNCLISGIADLQFVYLHCEIELMNIGFAPTCDDKLFDSALRRNFNAGKLPIFRIHPN